MKYLCFIGVGVDLRLRGASRRSSLCRMAMGFCARWVDSALVVFTNCDAFDRLVWLVDDYALLAASLRMGK